MCGIAGGWGKGISRDLLERMSEKIRHRGPDDSGVWIDNDLNIGFAHRRLSIIDLSKEASQPMIDSSGSLIITYNGEIYNYRELKKELELKGYKFKSSSDTEVILNLFMEYGHSLVEKLDGIYAFAIWDKRSRELFIVRDEFGIKPLYYSVGNDYLIFSSELKSLLEFEYLPKDINHTAIKDYLSYLYSPAPDTILKSINKLEPGSYLVFKDCKLVKKQRFFDVSYDLKNIDNKSSVEELSKKLAGNLKNAVEKQMVSDVPVGAFLSGGLDSSAIVAFARERISKINCFTIDFDSTSKGWEGFTRDFPYAKRVAEYLDVNLHRITVGPELITGLKEMVYDLDEPVADPASLNVKFISQLARENGIKVLLSGSGGDDIFTGYRRHYAVMQEKYWAWLPESFRVLLEKSSKRFSSRNALLRRVKKAFANAGRNTNERIAGYFRWADNQLINNVFSDDVLLCNDNDTLVELIGKNERFTDLGKMLYLETKGFLPDQNLLYTDKMSMNKGVEVRVPFLDKSLVSFAATIPDHMKQNGNCGKWVFKKAMEPYLPHDIIYRPKTGFGVPLRHWLHNEISCDVNELLSEDAVNRRAIFKYNEVKKIIELDKSGQEDYTYLIFSLMCIEMWLRRFID